MYVTMRDLKNQLRGKWAECLTTLAPQLTEAISRAPRGGPCPVHQGTDNFRFMADFRETGAAHSNKMGNSKYTKNGVFTSGVDVLMFFNGWGNQEIVVALCDWLGIDSGAPEGTKLPPVKAPNKIQETTQWNDFSIEKMTEWWKAAVGIERSEMVISYLASSNLAAIDLPHKGVLRFNSSLYYRDYDDDGEPLGPAQFLPALLAYIQDPQGKGVGVHRTYIDWEGKAAVADPRKLMTPIRRGGYSGAAVRLYDAEEGHIGLTESLETGFAVRLGTGQPIWSCLNRGMLECIVLPDDITSVDIWEDHDLSGDGSKSAKIAATRLRGEGRRVRRFKPPTVGQDWRDVWVNQGQSGFPPDACIAQEEKHEYDNYVFCRS